MFVFTEKPQVTWPVKVQQPMDGGTVEERRFQARFLILPDTGRAALLTGYADDSMKAIVRASVSTLEGIVDGQGNPVPFSPALLEAFVQTPFILAGLAAALVEVLSGKAAEGNSERSAEPGS